MNIRTNRFLVSQVMIISLVAGISNSFAQSPKEQEASKKPTGQSRMAEPDKEATIRNNLADLLTEMGVHVDKTLPSSDAQTHNEIRVRWQSSGTLKQANAANLEQRPVPGIVTLVASTKRDGILPRERSVELSTNQIMVIALDKNSGLRWWRLLLDPRLVRSEAPGATGDIRGENYYLARVDFFVEYPDDSGIKELRFYHPFWTGKDFRLEALSTLPVQ